MDRAPHPELGGGQDHLTAEATDHDRRGPYLARGDGMRDDARSTAIAADLAHVLADRLERRTQDVAHLLDVAGRHLPLSELEPLRRRAVE